MKRPSWLTTLVDRGAVAHSRGGGRREGEVPGAVLLHRIVASKPPAGGEVPKPVADGEQVIARDLTGANLAAAAERERNE